MSEPWSASEAAPTGARRWPFDETLPTRAQRMNRRRGPRGIGPLLALLFFALYALTYSATLTSKDGGVMYDTAMAMLNRHTLSLPPHHHGLPGVNGGFYSKYGIAQSVAEIPLFALGQALAPHVHAPLNVVIALALTMLTNPLIMALAVWLFFLLAYEANPDVRGAAFAAVLVGVASPFWPYAKTDFSEPLSLLTYIGAALFLVQARARPTAWRFALSGAFVALALLTKLTAAIGVPAIGLYALFVAWTTSRHRWPLALGRVLAWVVPILLGLGLVGWYNLARYGHLTDTGYHAGDLPFHAPLWPGLSGLLISPGKGLLWYCPLVLLALALWPALLRLRRAEGLMALGIVLPTLAVYATYPVWWGGICWGPRYLVPVLPFILLPLTYLWERFEGVAFVRRVATLIIALSVLVQVLGVAVHPNRFLATGIQDTVYLHQPADSPLLGHAWLAAYDAVRLFDSGDAASMLKSYPWRHPTGLSPAQHIAIDAWSYWWWEILGAHGESGRSQLILAAVAAVLLLAAALALRRRLRRLELNPFDHQHMAIQV